MLPVSDEPEIDDLMRDLTAEITHIYRWTADQAGMNTTDLLCLFYVRSQAGQATPKQISQHLGLTSGATAILLNRLEEAQYIERRPNPDDRRGVLISLGVAGLKAPFLRIRDYVRRMNAQVFKRYSAAELTVVRRFMVDLLTSTRDSLVRAREDNRGLDALVDDAPTD